MSVPPERRRAGYKGILTQDIKLIDARISEGDTAKLVSLQKHMEEYLSKIHACDLEILDDIEEINYDAALREHSDYTLGINDHIYRINGAIAQIAMGATLGATSGTAPITPTPKLSVKLPKLDISPYEGDVTEWRSFWELYSVSVHTRTDIETVQKFSYLRTLLKGEPLQLISGFRLEAATYTEAVDLLEKTYGKKDEIKLCLVKKLLSTEHSSYDAESLQHFRSQFECNIRSLEKEGLELNELYTILLYTRLPATLSENIKRKCGDDWLKFDEFKKGLEEEIRNLRAFPQQKTDSHQSLSTVSTFAIEQSQGTVRRKSYDSKVSTVPKTKQKGKKVCALCEQNHIWIYCKTYNTRDKKIELLKKLGLCFVCSSDKHISTDCARTGCGQGCSFRHHSVICPKLEKVNQNKMEKTKADVASRVQVTTLSLSDEQTERRSTTAKRTILPTATITLKGRGGRIVRERGLLDPCAERTFIKRSALENLQYKRKGVERMTLRGYLSTTPAQNYEIVTVFIPCKNKLINVDCTVVETLPEYAKKFEVKKHLKTLCKRKINLADKDFDLPLDKQASISMLIGVDNVYNILHPGFRKIDGLVLLPTIFGYVLTGKYNTDHQEEETHVSILKLAIETEEIGAESGPKKDLENLWTLDHLGINCSEITEQERKVLKGFENTITYSEIERQYVVALPWKTNKSRLPSNYGLALGRLKQQCTKFQNDTQYLENYIKVLSDQECRGFIERVKTNDSNTKCHFLAHHGVKKESVTTPLRVVFDCSARQSQKSLSLNDCLWTGPYITADLLKVLLQFRTNSFACISDIEKAFLMVQLREEDRDYTRFLWLEDPTNPESRIIMYRFRVVLFGATCSPFLLNATINKHLSTLGSGAEYIRKGIYVDNLQYTCNTSEELINYFFKVNKIFAEAHLYLKEWTTNNVDLQTLAQAYGISSKDDEISKVLGLQWEKNQDLLKVNQKSISKLIFTKREVLRFVAQIYDPLGVLLPVTVAGRIFLQKLWRYKLGWDSEFSDELKQEWTDIAQELQNCLHLTFPRSTSLGKGDTLHIFCDASESAYGCAAYMVGENKTMLLTAKARVAPIKELTVPRLELMAILLAARLAKFVMESFDNNEFKGIYIWSDSRVALSWLVSKHVLPVFVKNRVNEIHDLIPEANFSYVDTDENPSDLLTRGKQTDAIQANRFWWEGPSWLKNTPWPVDRSWETESQIQDGEKSILASWSGNHVTRLLDWERFSKLRRLERTVAWMLRFIYNIRNKNGKKNGDLTLEEEKAGSKQIILLMQKEYFPEEYKTLIKKSKGQKTNNALVNQLNLCLEDDIIKCKGRLEHSQLSYEAKFPILLHKGWNISKVIMRESHQRVAHMGVGATVADLRQRYWVPQARQLAKNEIHRCVTCKKVQGKPFRTNVMPSLPEFRVKMNQPFNITGVDYTGALTVKGTGHELGKAYIVLFTCPVTRAIHVEAVQNQSCDTFLMTFRKFCNRRTFPSVMLSDNATTFVAAADYLKEMADNIQCKEYLKEIQCTWKFIPARAPWFGAIWERLIGLFKSCLKKVLGQALLSFEELSCVVVELEAIINDRPLSYVPGEVNQLEVLTPNHLLYGRKLRSFPKEETNWEENYKDPSYGQKEQVEKRYQYIAKVCSDLWKRWEHEYLTTLRETHRTGKQHDSWPRKGDIVLIRDEGPRNRWKMGEVIELNTGPDSIPRVATVRTAQSQLIRPIVKLYPLELHQDLEERPIPASPMTNEQPGRPSRGAARDAAAARRALIESGLL